MSTRKNSAPVLPSSPSGDEARRAALLEAAFGVFARFGYRKTSMDEVARAAHISRQGLYLHFADKEDLFRATLRHALQSSLAAARSELTVKGAPLEVRLRGAFDASTGRYVGRFSANAADLKEAADGLVSTEVADYEKHFIESVAAELREGGLAAAYKPAGVTARQLAETLCATARGLKHSCETPEEFRNGFAIAVRIICAPLA